MDDVTQFDSADDRTRIRFVGGPLDGSPGSVQTLAGVLPDVLTLSGGQTSHVYELRHIDELADEPGEPVYQFAKSFAREAA